MPMIDGTGDRKDWLASLSGSVGNGSGHPGVSAVTVLVLPTQREWLREGY